MKRLRSEWIVCPNAFEIIIDQETFNKAQERLYWSNPLRWKRGVYFSDKIQSQFRGYLKNVLKTQLKMDEDKLWGVLCHFPMVVVATFYRNLVPRWCFTIQEQVRQYKYVLGVAVDISMCSSIDRFFLIPTSNFGLGNFLILSEQHPQYSNYLFNQELLEEKVKELCKDLS